MTAYDDGAPAGDSTLEAPPARRTAWLLLGSVVFVIAFVLGWRSAGAQASPTRDVPA